MKVGKTPKKRRIVVMGKAKLSIDRMWPDADKMEKVGSGIINLKYRNFTDDEKVELRRYLDQEKQKARLFLTHRDEYINNKCSHEERENKIKAFARIPDRKLMDLEKLPQSERLERLGDLIEEYDKSGNRCDHNNNKFACDGHYSPYDTGEKHDTYDLYGKGESSKRKPPIIYQTLDAIYYWALHPEQLPDLFMNKTNYVVKKWKKKIKNGFVRVTRGEKRSAVIKVLVVLLMHWDFVTMRVGIRKVDEDGTVRFLGLPISTIEYLTGLSNSRVDDALRFLESHNVLHKTEKDDPKKPGKKKSTQYREQRDDGSWKGFAVVRVFKPDLFDMLNMTEQLEEARSPKKVEKQDPPEENISLSEDRLPENASTTRQGGFKSLATMLQEKV